MKATAVESHHHHNHANVLGIRSQDGKVHKTKHKEEENEEIKAYLTKLQELVPFMPKNRKLSKLEVIQYVIDYIRDLRQTLGLPPQSNRLGLDLMDPMDMISAVTAANTTASSNTNSSSNINVISSSQSSSSHQQQQQPQPPHRQPLGVISTPNNSSLTGSCSSQEYLIL